MSHLFLLFYDENTDVCPRVRVCSSVSVRVRPWVFVRVRPCVFVRVRPCQSVPVRVSVCPCHRVMLFIVCSILSAMNSSNFSEAMSGGLVNAAGGQSAL